MKITTCSETQAREEWVVGVRDSAGRAGRRQVAVFDQRERLHLRLSDFFCLPALTCFGYSGWSAGM